MPQQIGLEAALGSVSDLQSGYREIHTVIGEALSPRSMTGGLQNPTLRCHPFTGE
jgi:hypothetical protein